jgi:hypothetical protein
MMVVRKEKCATEVCLNSLRGAIGSAEQLIPERHCMIPATLAVGPGPRTLKIVGVDESRHVVDPS